MGSGLGPANSNRISPGQRSGAGVVGRREIEKLAWCAASLFQSSRSVQVMSKITVFISYSHDSDEHREQVLRLSERLRADGISTILDRYVERGSPPGRVG